jgi:L-2-hydroxyglutarate oxidase
MLYDYAVVGGGIVGISTAWSLLQSEPGCKVVVLDKEDDVARHQTGRNSGVIHAGVYYAPGSLKARLCKEGAAATKAFCAAHDIPMEHCGKLIVATSELELSRLDDLEKRTQTNSIAYERLDACELRRREPNIEGMGAMLIPSTSIVNYGQITRSLANLVRSAGGHIRLGVEVRGLREENNAVELATHQGLVRARRMVNCAGLFADRLARWCGVGGDFRIVPFRGEYYRLGPDRNAIVRHLIYPVPDPGLPFLGVHLTRMIDGSVTVGPNAVLSLKREGYSRFAFNLRDAMQTLLFPGFWRVARANLRSGSSELANSLIKRRYLALCRKYCPDLGLSDFHPHAPGVRAQAVMRDGTLVHDFLIRRTARTIHVCNAPSPAATSALPIGREIAGQAQALER